MTAYEQIRPGDTVTDQAGHSGRVVSVWPQTQMAGTRFERVEERIVVNDGRFQWPWDWGVVVAVNGQPVDGPVQMELWSKL